MKLFLFLNMSTKITIRKFLASDINRIIEIEKASFPQGTYSKRRLKHLAQKHPNGFFVAQSADKPVGYIIAYTRSKIIDFDSLAVDKKFRRLGIGRTLVNLILKRFGKKGFKKASLEVRISNKKALSFFQSLGFEIRKILKKYYRDGEDAFRLEKQLN